MALAEDARLDALVLHRSHWYAEFFKILANFLTNTYKDLVPLVG